MAARCLVLVVLAFFFGVFVVGRVSGDDFRVETDVFVEDEEQPIVETLTIFSGDVIYDFLLGENGEITFFDNRQGGRIVLLDPARKIRTTLKTEELVEFVAAIKVSASQNAANLLVDPKFTTTFDEQTNELTLASERLTYRVKGMAAKDPSAVQRYRRFADWYARLNSARPGNLPPFARIQLDKALAERNLIPEEIERTLVFDQRIGDKEVVVRSRHITNWILSSTDRKRIDQVGRFMANFKKVGLAEYWRLNKVAARER